jgi:hypothetical protein
MTAICPICVSPRLRGQLDADVVRKLTLKELSQKYRLSRRKMMRHIKHLPEKLESEPAASKPSIYIGTMNVSVFVPPHEEENGGTADDPWESIATEGGGGNGTVHCS